MHGQMQLQHLLISRLLVHAERHHADQQVVSRLPDGGIHRYTYSALAARSRRLAKALQQRGMRQGDRVATLAWNGHRHMELYYAVSGSGAVLHTLNPRLHEDDITYIADHAEDQVLFFDLSFLPLVESIAGRVRTVKTFVAMSDRAQMPSSSPIPNLLCFEDLIADSPDLFEWPSFDENLASSLCYTSGTTGKPKGVLYSHRSTLLHAFALCMPDAFALSCRDTVLPVVPMFHANAWGLPYAACMVGAKLVFPGAKLDGESLYELFESERVSLSAGVPTVWQGLLAHLEANGLRFSTMRRTVIGGAACPPAMLEAFETRHDVRVLHAWGMTEISPLGTAASLKHKHLDSDIETRRAIQRTQGRAVFGVDMKIVGEHGQALPWDGTASGELMVQGPWVVDRYLHADNTALVDGWFPTGDIASIDPDGYMRITDRSKDVIKSGGEWIGSIDLENIAAAHPKVAMAACIAARHPKWDERPLLIVVRKPGAELTREALLDFFDGRVAKWWKPDDAVFVDTLPIGPTGKVLKHLLRSQYGNHLLGGR